LACHIGVSLGIASIGIAKKKLCGTVVGNNISIKNKKVAVKMKRLFISPGNKITLRSAIFVVKKYIYYTNPEPLRRAHIMANEERKNNES
jgi:deoxyribonuclease V